jgi:hypothetical protein
VPGNTNSDDLSRHEFRWPFKLPCCSW